MYLLIDRRQNLRLRKEIDEKISRLRNANLSLIYLQEFYPASKEIARLISEVDAELLSVDLSAHSITTVSK